MTTSSNLKIVGISGTFASGKDTLAEYLAEHNQFMHISTGDILREETQAKYGSTDRPVLHEHANVLRETRGAGILVEMAIDRYKVRAQEFPGGLVVSGVRSIGEAEKLKEAGGKLVFVDADIKVRYERAHKRKRDVEAKITFEDFKASEEAELNKPMTNKTDQNILGVKKFADVLVDNSDGIENFIKEALKAIGIQ